MKSAPSAYQPHLVVETHSIASGQEWTPRFPGWSMIQIGGGAGYWMQSEASQPVDEGAVILLGPELKKGSLRASQLGEMAIKVLPIDLDRLVGVFTVTEQKSFESAARRYESSLKIFSPTDAFSARVQEAFLAPAFSGPAHRLRMLQFFVEAVSADVTFDSPASVGPQGARTRLEDFLARTPAADLATLKITDIARATRCGPRHLSRLFHEIFKTSFREKQTELRLKKACELLATTDFKIVEIALESGYQSVSLFSLMFTRRFGMSPGRWRVSKKTSKPVRPRRMRVAPAFA